MIITIIRTETSDEGTFGDLSSDEGFSCKTGELPWRDDEKGKSCIEEGTYTATWSYSPKFGRMCYHLDDDSRSSILIHTGNFCGNVDEGFKSDVEGCILLGESVGSLNGQKAVLLSKKAVTAFETHLDKKPFTLVISWSGDLP